jgi:hypothetical protein
MARKPSVRHFSGRGAIGWGILVRSSFPSRRRTWPKALHAQGQNASASLVETNCRARTEDPSRCEIELIAAAQFKARWLLRVRFESICRQRIGVRLVQAFSAICTSELRALPDVYGTLTSPPHRARDALVATEIRYPTHWQTRDSSDVRAFP